VIRSWTRAGSRCPSGSSCSACVRTCVACLSASRAITEGNARAMVPILISVRATYFLMLTITLLPPLPTPRRHSTSDLRRGPPSQLRFVSSATFERFYIRRSCQLNRARSSQHLPVLVNDGDSDMDAPMSLRPGVHQNSRVANTICCSSAVKPSPLRRHQQRMGSKHDGGDTTHGSDNDTTAERSRRHGGGATVRCTRHVAA